MLFLLFIIVWVSLYILHLFRTRQIIRDANGSPYLIRYFIWKPNGLRRRIYLHHILRSDHDRALHDHPWPFTSVILLGGYWEHSLRSEIWSKPPWYGPLTIIRRGPKWRHRLELPEGKTAWTLFFTGVKCNSWGFYPDGKYCHHSKYNTLTGLCDED
jgi:hypothetical protein